MSTSQQQHQKSIPFFYIEEGIGGIVQLPPPQGQALTTSPSTSAVTSVGTDGVYTCVGVYIPLTARMCFVAHILATRDERGDNDKRWICSEEEGARLRNFVKDRFIRHLGAGLRPDQQAKESAVVVCIRPRAGRPDEKSGLPTGALMTGYYIAQAFLEFLNLDYSRLEQRTNGFVVNHATRNAVRLRYDADQYEFESPEQHGNERVTQRLQGLDVWRIRLRNGEWSVE